MPDIVFPDAEPRYDAARDLLVFRAVADGRPLQCMISAELLRAEFGATGPEEAPMREAFATHKEAILALAREHIGNGWIDPEGRVFLSVRRTRLETRFSPRLNAWAEGRKLALEAQRELLPLIGPMAERVLVEWDCVRGDQGKETVLLRISDPALPTASASVLLPARLWGSLDLLVLKLAGTWREILSAQSREFLFKAG